MNSLLLFFPIVLWLLIFVGIIYLSVRIVIYILGFVK